MNANPEKLPLAPGHRVLRYVGAVFLSTCAVMLVLGLTTLQERLHGLQIVRYWTWCFLLALASIICALSDAILVRRAFKRTRRQLFHEQFMSDELTDKFRKKKDK